MNIQINFNDYISGTSIQSLSNAQILDSGAVKIHNIGIRGELPILYCHTHQFNNNIKQISEFNEKFVLITHNSDGKIVRNPNPNDADVRLMPPAVSKWFGCNIIDHNEKTVSIPTGLENTHHFPELNKSRRIFDINSKRKDVRNLCYMNFNVNTNPAERGMLFNTLSDKEWVTTHQGANGIDFDNYLDNIYNHAFVLCPEGNSNGHPVAGGGVASHRMWETLYANSIPIATKGTQSEQFYDLPILFVDSWDQVTEEFLRNKYEEFKTKTFNVDKLKLSYWVKQIHG